MPKNQYEKHNHHHYENLNKKKKKKIEIRNILIRKKRYEKVVIYFTRYHHGKSLTMLSLYHDELLGKIEDYEGEKKLDDW